MLPSLKWTWSPHLATNVLEVFIWPFGVGYHHVYVVVIAVDVAVVVAVDMDVVVWGLSDAMPMVAVDLVSI